jgi:hypothetical protein
MAIGPSQVIDRQVSPIFTMFAPFPSKSHLVRSAWSCGKEPVAFPAAAAFMPQSMRPVPAEALISRWAISACMCGSRSMVDAIALMKPAGE